MEAKLGRNFKTQTVNSPNNAFKQIKLPKKRKIAAAKRSPVRDQVQILDKPEPSEDIIRPQA